MGPTTSRRNLNFFNWENGGLGFQLGPLAIATTTRPIVIMMEKLVEMLAGETGVLG
jgi:hypothetical protein